MTTEGGTPRRDVITIANDRIIAHFVPKNATGNKCGFCLCLPPAKE